MKIDIPKEWILAKLAEGDEGEIGAGNPTLLLEHTCAQWFTQLTALANTRGLGWLIGDVDSHRAAFDEGLSPEQELDEQIAVATVIWNCGEYMPPTATQRLNSEP